MRKPLETLKKVNAVMQKSIVDILRKLKRKTIMPESDNFNHLLYYSLDYTDFLPIVADKLLQTFKHAKREKLNVGKYFLVNLQRFSEYLKLDKQVVICILYYMEEHDLAYYTDSGIANTKLVWIKESKLLQYVPEYRQEDNNYLEYLQKNKQNEEYKFFNYFPKYREKRVLFIYRIKT